MAHVLRHLPWYLLLRPAGFGDWPGAAFQGMMLALCGLLLALGCGSRAGVLWAWWRRWAQCGHRRHRLDILRARNHGVVELPVLL